MRGLWAISAPSDFSTFDTERQCQVLATYVVYYAWGIITIFLPIVWE
jgi:hypothetical protein